MFLTCIIQYYSNSLCFNQVYYGKRVKWNGIIFANKIDKGSGENKSDNVLVYGPLHFDKWMTEKTEKMTFNKGSKKGISFILMWFFYWRGNQIFVCWGVCTNKEERRKILGFLSIRYIHCLKKRSLLLLFATLWHLNGISSFTKVVIRLNGYSFFLIVV